MCCFSAKRIDETKRKYTSCVSVSSCFSNFSNEASNEVNSRCRTKDEERKWEPSVREKKREEKNLVKWNQRNETKRKKERRRYFCKSLRCITQFTGAIRRSQLTYPTMPYRFDESKQKTKKEKTKKRKKRKNTKRE